MCFSRCWEFQRNHELLQPSQPCESVGTGQPITVVTLGGSIMAGGDIYFPRKTSDSFVGQLFTWLAETFPHAQHKFHNGCLPATGSTFISICLDEHVVHKDVDLILLEFDINDASPDGAETKADAYLPPFAVAYALKACSLHESLWLSVLPSEMPRNVLPCHMLYFRRLYSKY
jgi:hypothetical protein